MLETLNLSTDRRCTIRQTEKFKSPQRYGVRLPISAGNSIIETHVNVIAQWNYRDSRQFQVLLRKYCAPL